MTPPQILMVLSKKIGHSGELSGSQAHHQPTMKATGSHVGSFQSCAATRLGEKTPGVLNGVFLIYVRWVVVVSKGWIWSRQHAFKHCKDVCEHWCLGILEMLCLTKGVQYGTVLQSWPLNWTVHWSGLWGASTWHIKGILDICVVRLRFVCLSCGQEREKLRQSNAKAPVSDVSGSSPEAGREEVGYGTVFQFHPYRSAISFQMSYMFSKWFAR